MLDWALLSIGMNFLLRAVSSSRLLTVAQRRVSLMSCPDCGSCHIRKNGHRRGKQNHICVHCHRQFVESDESVETPQSVGYSDWVKRLCLRM